MKKMILSIFLVYTKEGGNDILTLVMVMQFTITDNKKRFIVISDLHLCSIKDRIDLVYKAYLYALDNEIYSIINLGDLIDSVMPHNYKHIRFNDIEKQIRYVVENYPLSDRITTYVLYGNHDYYKLFTSGIDVAKIISEERNDLVNLGYGEAYLNLDDNYIKLSHPIKYLNHYKKNIKTPLRLLGHYHRYRVDYTDSIAIYVPSLSDLSTEWKLSNKPEILDMSMKFQNGVLSNVSVKNIDIEHDIINSELNLDLNISPKRHAKVKEYFKS